MRKHLSKSGVTMVETAAMLIFIFALLGIIITGGQMVSNKNALNYATQAAIRMSAVQPTKSEAEKVAKDTAKAILESNGLATSGAEVSLSAANGWTRGETFSLTVETTYKTLFPLIGMQTSGSQNTYTMSTKVVAMVEAR